MTWYDNNSNDWYSPNSKYEDEKPPQAPAAVKPVPAAPKPKKRGRKGLLILLIIVLGLGQLALYGFTVLSLYSIRESLEQGYNDDGMPSSWQEYFDMVYEVDITDTGEYDLPALEDPGELQLVFADESGEPMSFKEIYASSAPSIVGIKCFDESDTDSYIWGSGMIVSEDGYIITNAHVIDDCSSAQVLLSDGSSYDAKLVGASSKNDIAILKINKTGLVPVVFESSSRLSVGDSVAAIGNPISPQYSLTMTSGIISALDRDVTREDGRHMHCLQTDTSINSGNSGGPLFNEYGHVVGITNMKLTTTSSTSVEGMGFAIPSDTVKEITDSIMGNDIVPGAATVGIIIGPVTEGLAEYYDIPNGLYVTKVYENSDAAKSLKKGDILIEVNGKECHETDDVASAKEGLEIGDTLHFKVWRDGKTFEVDVKLSDSSNVYNLKK